MSSLAYNLTRKIEWMGRRLRHINDVDEITKWVSAMKDINCLLNEVDIKECIDSWKPWRKRDYRNGDYGVKKDMGKSNLETTTNTRPNKKIQKMETIPTLGLKDRLLKELKMKDEWKLPTQSVLPPRVQVDVDVNQMSVEQVEVLDEQTLPYEKRKRQRVMKERNEDCGDTEDGEQMFATMLAELKRKGYSSTEVRST